MLKYMYFLFAAGINTAARGSTGENNANVIPLQEMDSIVDADMAMMDNNRLHYYRRLDCEYVCIASITF